MLVGTTIDCMVRNLLLKMQRNSNNNKANCDEDQNNEYATKHSSQALSRDICEGLNYSYPRMLALVVTLVYHLSFHDEFLHDTITGNIYVVCT